MKMQKVQYDYLYSRYQELTILGSEEKKSTYLALDEVSGQIVVKKYIQLESADVYERLCALNSKHLQKIFYVARNENTALVIMEYVSGRTIEERQKEISVFSERETIFYIKQLLKGLSEIHKSGIIHRDINPRNVLISTDGVVKLLDFDIGRQYKQSQGSDTAILGTVGYAAPEQFGFTQSDKRTDIYAVGVLMNVMLTGKLPGEQVYTNRRIGYIIRTCTQLDPEKRYQSAEEILYETEILREVGLQKPKEQGSIEHNRQSKRPHIESGEKGDTSEKSIIPGFRTGMLWKKIIAVAYYIMMGIYSVASIVECSVTPLAAILELAAVSMYIWLTVFLPLNFLDWMHKVPIVRKLEKTGRIVLGVILWVFLFYSGYALEQYVRVDMLHIAVRTTK